MTRPGPLKLVSPLTPVSEAVKGTAAADVPALAPLKPKTVADDPVMNAAWDEIVPQLDQSGLMTPADVMAVELCLRHFVTARKAHEDVMERGVWITINEERPQDGEKKNPAEAVFRMESTHFLEYAKQLGMTFAARARTAVPKGAEGGSNPFASQSAASG